MCLGDMSVVVFGDSLKVFGFRPDWYSNGRLVGMEVLKKNSGLWGEDILSYMRILKLNCDLEYE